MEIISSVIKATGWTIIHSLWQAAILYAVLFLILLISPKSSSASKHNLCFLTLLSIFVWSGITFYTEIIKSFTVNKNLDNFIHSQYGGITDSITNIPSSTSYQVEQYFPVLVFIYVIGLIIHIALLLIEYYKTRKIKTVGLTELPLDLHKRFMDLIAKIGITRKVRFNISSRVSVPLVIGYFKPMILLPLSIITQLEVGQLEAIIIHELSHIRRNDYMLNLVKICIETIMFFNPFVLMTGRMINNERENACDDLVLEMTGTPLLYIETLYQIQQLKYKQEQFSMAIAGKNYTLLNRIKRIATLDTREYKKQPLTLFLILAITMLVAGIPIRYEKTKISKALITDNKVRSSIKQQIPLMEVKVKSKAKIADLKESNPPVQNKETDLNTAHSDKTNDVQNSDIGESYPLGYSKVINVNATTDTVKFELVNNSSSEKYKGVFIIEDKIYSNSQIENMIAQSGNLKMIVRKPSIAVIDGNSARDKYGESAKDGAIIIKSSYKEPPPL